MTARELINDPHNVVLDRILDDMPVGDGEEVAGASVTLLRLDEELRRLVDALCETPAFTQV